MPAGKALDGPVLLLLDQRLGCGRALLVQHLFELLEALFVLKDFQWHDVSRFYAQWAG
jgi:hypothetical protein